MSEDICYKIEDLFDNNLIDFNRTKEFSEKIKVMLDLIRQEDIKKQLADIIRNIEAAAELTEESSKFIKVEKECKRAKEILFSFPIKTLNEFQNELSKTAIDDFYLINYDRNKIIFAGGFDYIYCHEVELNFMGVDFICCSNNFSANCFRLASDEEISYLKKMANRDFCFGLTFCMQMITKAVNKEIISYGEKNYITAHDLKVNWGNVYHYKRDNLQPGEKIADWVV